MTAVFVHGNPDTYRVWNLVRGRIGDVPSVALSLPGFGCPIPAGFTATKEEYVAWLIAALEQQPEPVDLVGHDWGCLLTMRVASLRPDLVRSWAAGSGPVSSAYIWHVNAQVWQTSGEGEAWMDRLDPTAFAATLVGNGIPEDLARDTARRIDPLMKGCILRLYRSAVTLGAEWEPGLADIHAPGLVLWGERDQSCPVAFADRLGRDAHAARVLTFADCGHWWQVTRADETADALLTHWQHASDHHQHG